MGNTQPANKRSQQPLESPLQLPERSREYQDDIYLFCREQHSAVVIETSAGTEVARQTYAGPSDESVWPLDSIDETALVRAVLTEEYSERIARACSRSVARKLFTTIPEENSVVLLSATQLDALVEPIREDLMSAPSREPVHAVHAEL